MADKKRKIAKQLVCGMLKRLGLTRRPSSMADLARHAIHQKILEDRCADCEKHQRCADFQARMSHFDQPPRFCAMTLAMFKGDLKAKRREHDLREQICGTLAVSLPQIWDLDPVDGVRTSECWYKAAAGVITAHQKI